MLIPMLRDVHQVTVKVCLYAYLHTISLTPPEVEIEVEVQCEKLCTTDVHHVSCLKSFTNEQWQSRLIGDA